MTISRHLYALLAFACAVLLSAPAWAFDAPEDSSGTMKAALTGPSEWTSQTHEVRLVVTNSGSEAITGAACLNVIDGWKVDPAEPRSLAVPAGQSAEMAFQVTAAPNTLAAHYPVHGWFGWEDGAQVRKLHPVLLTVAKIPGQPNARTALAGTTAFLPEDYFAAPEEKEVGLWFLPVRRVLILVDGEETRVQPVRWEGVESVTSAHLSAVMPMDRGGMRQSIGMHPPFAGGRTGAIIVEYPLTLPSTGPLTLTFANALRDTDSAKGEPPSDGITFRVRVVPSDAPDGTVGEVVSERHVTSKTWDEAQADLSRFAGQKVRVQLEANPGPAKDTTCDMGYWGEPVLRAGEMKTARPMPRSTAQLLGRIPFDGGSYAVFAGVGEKGLLDCAFTFDSGKATLRFEGFDINVMGFSLTDPRSPCALSSVEIAPIDRGIRVRHGVSCPYGRFDLLAEVKLDKGALSTRFWLENAPESKPWFSPRIDDISLRPWSEIAQRVYTGVGNVLVNPETFTLGFDGHQCSTSFTGLDFPNGVSLVFALDTAPDKLVINPETRTYTYHTPNVQTWSLIPAPSAFDAAIAWRKLDSRPAADGVKDLAGRFAFDLWGTLSANTLDEMKSSFAYGLTNSIVLWHNWQRYGYDYRLPDIFPINPAAGNDEDMKALAALCRENKALFALHDNYIDFYPDARDFSYDKVDFNAYGDPCRGWLNEGRAAQAYRWRPSAFQPFLENNISSVRASYAPTAYFLDVFSSIGPHDSWSRDGVFSSRQDTERLWGEAFTWIRDNLVKGRKSPAISESGHDRFIGALDGAQTNHLRVDGDPPPGDSWTTWRIQCSDSERIPWIDTAHHQRFVLHGAGYESRYIGGLPRATNGIYSDDYMSTEMLTGHPGMVPEAFNRNVVRKYWLTNSVQRALAEKSIAGVTFSEDDIHCQRVEWEGGGEVHVNRGLGQWIVGRQTLPQYGYHARIPDGDDVFEAAIESRPMTSGSGASIAEWSSGPNSLYVNARPAKAEEGVISLKSYKITAADAATREGKITLAWSALRALSVNARVYVHFVDLATNKILFQADFDPTPATMDWQGDIVVSTPYIIPAGFEPGQKLGVNVGLYSADGSGNLAISKDFKDGKVSLGALELFAALPTDGQEGVMKSMDSKVLERLNAASAELDFGPVATDGACRIEKTKLGVVVTPLPESPAFTLRVTWADLPWKSPTPGKCVALAMDGTVKGEAPVTLDDGVVTLTCQPEVFAYRLESAAQGAVTGPAPGASPGA